MPRPKRDFRTTSKEAFKEFKTLYPNVKITYAQYKKILYTFNEMLFTHILETGTKYKMPYGMGELTIRKKKMRTYYENKENKFCILPVNWQETKKYGKIIYNMNYHTDGYRYSWRYSFKNARFSNKDVWGFKATRTMSRTLAKYINKPDSLYKDLYQDDTRFY